MSGRVRGFGELLLCAFALLALWSGVAGAGAYVFAGEGNGVHLVTHPTGYNGTGGVLTVDVCIAPSSPNASLMAIPVQNVVNTYQHLIPTTQNVSLGGNNDVPSGTVDFESVALHEVGHCIGMAHANLASESGLGDPQANGTRSTDGADNTYNVGAGADGVIGSSDDVRGDDVILHWFRKADNNPFGVAAIVDSTTYSRDLADLPSGHSYAVNAGRAVSNLLGVPSSEAVMQQLTFYDEAQRTLVGDDVATLRLAMAGLDEIAGTSDDYTINLRYRGLRNNCDVKLDFDNTQTGFAVCSTGGSFLGSHAVITSANIYFNTGYSWHFTSSIAPICGDGVVDAGEGCDDGAAMVGDGCNSQCEVESGWSCSGQPSSCVELCGDGILTPSESCDDGNTVSGDCCSATCQPEASGNSCDDGDPCAVNDTCDGGGNCQPGDPIDCDDGTFCNGVEVCTVGLGCEAGPPPVLDDGVTCTLDFCYEQAKQVVHVADDSACDDGAYCNGAETCSSTLDCQAGLAPATDDGVACTLDSCDEVLDVVLHDPEDMLCDDADACTADACSAVEGCGHATVDCDDLDPCTSDSCDSGLGCVHEPIATCVAVPTFSNSGHLLLAALILAMGSMALAWRAAEGTAAPR